MSPSFKPKAVALLATLTGVAGLLLGACSSSSSSVSPGAAVDAGVGDAAITSDGGTAAAVDAGPSTTAGSADGTPFTTVVSSLWAGAADSASTTVVYLFSKQVDCSAISSPAWDSRITDGTQVLEMKTLGSTPQPYKVVKTATPGAGEASVNYTLSSTKGTPVETASTAGTVTIESLVASTQVTGSFALTFGTNSLNGTFNAAFCPGGHEP